MKTVYFDKGVVSNVQGFNSLVKLYHEISNSEDKDIEINYSHTTVLEGNLCSVLGSIADKLKDNGYNIVSSKMNDNILEVFYDSGFLFDLPYSQEELKTNNIITYQRFTPEQEDDFKKYIIRELTSKVNFPKLSALLQKRIGESIFEVFENARTHGKCKLIHTCGHSSTTKDRLDFAIVDMGQTIHNNVNDFLSKHDRYLDACESIEWAFQGNNTTKINHTGGLGLKVIKEFIRVNNGKIEVVSSNGYWKYYNDKVEKSLLDYPFPGTIVNIEFNYDEKKYYYFKSEENLSLDNIF